MAAQLHGSVTNPIDPTLQRDIDNVALPGMLIGHRLISLGDEHALLAQEAASIVTSVADMRRASGAARIVARELLAQLGYPNVAVPRGASGEPIWPAGVTGSLAHDDRVAVAAVGLLRDVRAVGVDVEPAVPLPPEVLELIATPQELCKIVDDPLRGKLLFAAKEAVYKAVYPLDGIFLDHHDVEVDLASASAVVRQGRVVRFRHCVATHIVVLAFISAGEAAV